MKSALTIIKCVGYNVYYFNTKNNISVCICWIKTEVLNVNYKLVYTELILVQL